MVSESVLTEEAKNYLSLVRSKIAIEDTSDQSYDIAITIDVDFKKAIHLTVLALPMRKVALKSL